MTSHGWKNAWARRSAMASWGQDHPGCGSGPVNCGVTGPFSCGQRFLGAEETPAATGSCGRRRFSRFFQHSRGFFGRALALLARYPIGAGAPGRRQDNCTWVRGLLFMQSQLSQFERHQLDVIARVTPHAMAGHLLNTTVQAVALAGSIPSAQLIVWCLYSYSIGLLLLIGMCADAATSRVASSVRLDGRRSMPCCSRYPGEACPRSILERWHTTKS